MDGWMDFWVILSKNGKKRQIVLKTSKDRVTNKVEIDDVSQTLSTFLTGMNFPNYLASLEKSSE